MSGLGSGGAVCGLGGGGRPPRGVQGCPGIPPSCHGNFCIQWEKRRDREGRGQRSSCDFTQLDDVELLDSTRRIHLVWSIISASRPVN